MASHIVQRLRRLIACMQVAIFGSLCLVLVGCKSREAAATANGPAHVQMRAGGFRQITGTGFLMASAYAKKESGVLEKLESGSYSDSYSSSYGGRIAPAHNLLFSSIDDLSGRWLLSHNRFLIWATEELPPAKDSPSVRVYKMTIPEQRVARWIYIEVAKSDTKATGHDKRPTDNTIVTRNDYITTTIYHWRKKRS